MKKLDRRFPHLFCEVDVQFILGFRFPFYKLYFWINLSLSFSVWMWFHNFYRILSSRGHFSTLTLSFHFSLVFTFFWLVTHIFFWFFFFFFSVWMWFRSFYRTLSSRALFWSMILQMSSIPSMRPSPSVFSSSTVFFNKTF